MLSSPDKSGKGRRQWYCFCMEYEVDSPDGVAHDRSVLAYGFASSWSNSTSYGQDSEIFSLPPQLSSRASDF